MIVTKPCGPSPQELSDSKTSQSSLIICIFSFLEGVGGTMEADRSAVIS
jgi:hypothetical protein